MPSGQELGPGTPRTRQGEETSLQWEPRGDLCTQSLPMGRREGTVLAHPSELTEGWSSLPRTEGRGFPTSSHGSNAPTQKCRSRGVGKVVLGDLFSGAVFSELGRTSGTQLTGEGRKIKSATVSPSIFHEVMGPDAVILVFYALLPSLIPVSPHGASGH